MYRISDEQIDYILNDIRRRGVELEDLQLNLLDHICCIIEQNLKVGEDFEDFYQRQIKTFFKHELWEIEEETLLLLTYKNYYTMKKAMIYGGVFSLALIALGTVFKIFHWPGSAISLLLGFLVLCFVFFPATLYLNYSTTKKALGVNLSAFAGGTVLMLGVLFKVMHWPGASMLLILGFAILLIIFIPLLLFSKLREDIPASQKRIYTLGAIALIIFEAATLFKMMHWPGTAVLLLSGSFLLIGMFIPLYTKMQVKSNAMNAGQFVFVITLSMYAIALTYLLAMSVAGPVLERFSRDEADNSNIIKYFEKKKERLLGEMANDSAQTAQSKNKKLVTESAGKTKAYINSLRIEIVGYVEEVDQTTARELALHPNSIQMKSNYDKVNQLFVYQDGPRRASDLKLAIEKYRSTTLKAAENNDQLSNKIQHLLNTDGGGVDADGAQISWEEKNFRNSMLISTLSRLSEIEKNICLIETEVLSN